MKLVFGITLLIMVFASCPFANAQSLNTVVIQGATIIDGTGRTPFKDVVIVIEGSRRIHRVIKGGVVYDPATLLAPPK